MRFFIFLFLMNGYVFSQSNEVTFTKDISPIIYNKCTSCHRVGESGPMSFTSYEEVASLGSMIEYVKNTTCSWPPDPAYNFCLMRGSNRSEKLNKDGFRSRGRSRIRIRNLFGGSAIEPDLCFNPG